MASNLLRVALHRVVARRPLHLTGSAGIHKFFPTPSTDPNINLDFYESLTTPLPAFPRVIGFEGELKALKEKEKGDWKSLTQEDRMDLYNMYFSMSMADMLRTKDEYKSVFGVVCMFISLSLLFHWFVHEYVLPPYHPSSTNAEWVQATIKKQIQLHANPITGYASLWDYENNCWKK